jgi:2-succinyl-5-enolpyruvyl-6-hydroxy-3-cyclohexene-1-carboxylate synthase
VTDPPTSLADAWAQLAVDALATAGVVEVVLCPGARSAPLTLAAGDSPRLRTWTIVDERAAAFFALGQAKVTGRPTAVICTSGTAGAHFFPAVLEAEQSHTPLLLFTADRPPELIGCDAPQTIQQAGLFGRHVRLAVDLGPPSPDEAALRGLRRSVVQAVAATRWPDPGPVHVNVPLREPLLSHERRGLGPTDGDRALAALVDRVRAEPLTRTAPPTAMPSGELLRAVAERIRLAPRGLVLCGPAAVAQGTLRTAVERLARLAGYPVAAELPSQLRAGPRNTDGEIVYVDQLELLLRTTWGRRLAAPELVVQLGAPPTSSGARRLVEGLGHDAAEGGRHVVLTAHGWADPTGRAALRLVGHLDATLSALCELLSQGPREIQRAATRRRWLGSWEAAQLRATVRLARPTAAPAHTQDTVAREPHHLRELLAALPPGTLLAVGNSLPVRLVDQLCAAPSQPLAIWSQRGVNGIDGLVAGASGAASVHEAGPTCLLLGDVSLLHDVGSLAAARSAHRPLAIVVVNNGGGRIFEQLPVADVAQEPSAAYPRFRRDFLTPPELDCGALAQAFGLRYTRVESPTACGDAVRAALADSTTGGGPRTTLVELMAAPSSAREELAETVAALETLGPVATPRRRVALHGFANGPGMWRRTVEAATAQGASLPNHCPPLPWHASGPGELDWEPSSFIDAVDGLAARLQEASDGPVHLVGYSLGARIALGLLVRHPSLAAAATLVGLHPGLRTKEERRQRRQADGRWIELLREERPDALERFVAQWEAQPLFATQRQLPAALVEAQRQGRRALHPRALARALERLGLAEMPSYWDQLGAIAVPVQLVVGELDEKFYAIAREAVNLLPLGQLRVVAGCGHNVPLERPEQLAALWPAMETSL